jgi:hypothetical protein
MSVAAELPLKVIAFERATALPSEASVPPESAMVFVPAELLLPSATVPTVTLSRH